MSETTVIHVRDMQPGDKYIGRACPRRRLAASPFANPFRIDDSHDRATVIHEHDVWVRTSNDQKAVYIREHLEELRGHRIACHCYPLPCHGDTYVRLLARRSQ